MYMKMWLGDNKKSSCMHALSLPCLIESKSMDVYVADLRERERGAAAGVNPLSLAGLPRVKHG